MTQREIADTLKCSRQMAALHLKRGCPRTSPEAVLAWYHSNVRCRSDRPRPNAPRIDMSIVQPFSLAFDLDEYDVRDRLFREIAELPREIASEPTFLPTIDNNRAVRAVVERLITRWCTARE